MTKILQESSRHQCSRKGHTEHLLHIPTFILLLGALQGQGSPDIVVLQQTQLSVGLFLKVSSPHSHPENPKVACVQGIKQEPNLKGGWTR